jgi:hypothetical protein
MRSRRLAKTDRIEMDGCTYTVDYFEVMTDRGTERYSAEMVLRPGDRIIVDGNSLGALEWRVTRLIPATLYSRMLARAAT